MLATCGGGVTRIEATPTNPESARAAAWVWYERRRAAVEAADRKGWAAPGDPFDPWPAALTWSEEQVFDVEIWRAKGGDLPAVLRSETNEKGQP